MEVERTSCLFLCNIKGEDVNGAESLIMYFLIKILYAFMSISKFVELFQEFEEGTMQ